MKKVFISVPMKGRSDEKIGESIVKMHRIAEIVYGEPLEAIDNFTDYDNIPEGADHSIYCLGEAIKKLSEADYFIGIYGSMYFNGCNIEHEIAHRYGIPVFELDIYRTPFLKDALLIEKKNREVKFHA